MKGKEKPPEGGSLFNSDVGSDRRHHCWFRFPTIRHEPNASETEQHHRPCREFGDSAERPEQSVRLPIDTVGKEESVGIATIAPIPENKRPKAARAVRARVNRDTAEKSTGGGVEGINLAESKTEVADEQVAAELAETFRGESETPGRCELAACNPLQKESILVEDIHDTLSPRRRDLVRSPGGRVRYINFAANVRNIEWNKSRRKTGVGESIGAEADGRKGTVEGIDPTGPRAVRGEDSGLRAVDGQTGVDRPQESLLEWTMPDLRPKRKWSHSSSQRGTWLTCLNYRE